MKYIIEIIYFTLISLGLIQSAKKKIDKNPGEYFQIHFQYLIFKLGMFFISLLFMVAMYPELKAGLILVGLATFIIIHFFKSMIIQKQLLKQREFNGR